MLKRAFFTVCVAVFVLAIAGCSESTETPPADGTVDTQPTPGTDMSKTTTDETP
jgi:hypothetical protein